jgi:hypothetical protein
MTGNEVWTLTCRLVSYAVLSAVTFVVCLPLVWGAVDIAEAEVRDLRHTSLTPLPALRCKGRFIRRRVLTSASDPVEMEITRRSCCRPEVLVRGDAT